MCFYLSWKVGKELIFNTGSNNRTRNQQKALMFIVRFLFMLACWSLTLASMEWPQLYCYVRFLCVYPPSTPNHSLLSYSSLGALPLILIRQEPHPCFSQQKSWHQTFSLEQAKHDGKVEMVANGWKGCPHIWKWEYPIVELCWGRQGSAVFIYYWVLEEHEHGLL